MRPTPPGAYGVGAVPSFSGEMLLLVSSYRRSGSAGARPPAAEVVAHGAEPDPGPTGRRLTGEVRTAQTGRGSAERRVHRRLHLSGRQRPVIDPRLVDQTLEVLPV